MVNYISMKLCKHYSGLFFIILSSNTSSVHVFFYSDTNIDMIENGKKNQTQTDNTQILDVSRTANLCHLVCPPD